MHTIGIVTGFILIGLIIKTDINVNGIVVFVYMVQVSSTSIHYMCFAREVTSKRLSRKIKSQVSSPVVRKEAICTLCKARFKFTSIKFCYDIFSLLGNFLLKCENNANQLYVAKCVQYLYDYHFVFKHVGFVRNSCKKVLYYLNMCLCTCTYFQRCHLSRLLTLVSFFSKLSLLCSSIYSNSAV